MEKRQSTRQHWEAFWEQKNDVQHVYDNTARIVPRIKNVLGDLTGKRILEVGAGTGRVSLLLAQAGAEVYVLDYADNSLSLMRRIAEEQQVSICLIKGDAFRLPVKDNSFDLVFHQGLLEHFIDPQGILDENFRILKPDGFALIDVPQKYHIYTIIKHFLILINRWFAGWETEFSAGQLKQRMQYSGFIIHERYGEWMQPSLFYRIFREALLKMGLRIRLYPVGIPGFRRLRKHVRNSKMAQKLAIYTGLDLGIIGKKQISAS